ncbi:MAG TPA: hypothetical protein VGF77_10615 [Allosphingosinicella sp.]|jgi:hypothetical protein
MPRFFFHLSQRLDGPDVLGTHMSGVAEAMREAVVTLGQVIQDRPEAILSGADLSLTVRDEKDVIFFTVAVHAARPAATAIRIVGPARSSRPGAARSPIRTRTLLPRARAEAFRGAAPAVATNFNRFDILFARRREGVRVLLAVRALSKGPHPRPATPAIDAERPRQRSGIPASSRLCAFACTKIAVPTTRAPS